MYRVLNDEVNCSEEICIFKSRVAVLLLYPLYLAKICVQQWDIYNTSNKMFQTELLHLLASIYL